MLIKPEASQVSAQAQRGQVATAGKAQERFSIPVPGRDGCPPNSLAGKTVVLTGVFPEVGGGAGLELGKERTRAMVESFGGRVTSAVSGRTNILLTGKEPGFSKVTKARNSGAELMSLHQMASFLRGQKSLEAAVHEQPLQITSFSAGYFRGGGYNNLAQYASPAQLAYAAGQAPKQIAQGPGAQAEPLKKKARKSTKAPKLLAAPPAGAKDYDDVGMPDDAGPHPIINVGGGARRKKK